MSERLTAWFPESTKPVHQGVYLVRTDNGTFWRYWDGKKWRWGRCAADASPTCEWLANKGIAIDQDVEWCGLVQEAA
ncbi:hypothetical protein [Paraburkholderia sp.]|uniref:hypothetical protein n=1 Tax=Paraburkholderia sp. TaxID=1926495 RepID=UPI0039E2C9A7